MPTFRLENPSSLRYNCPMRFPNLSAVLTVVSVISALGTVPRAFAYEYTEKDLRHAIRLLKEGEKEEAMRSLPKPVWPPPQAILLEEEARNILCFMYNEKAIDLNKSGAFDESIDNMRMAYLLRPDEKKLMMNLSNSLIARANSYNEKKDYPAALKDLKEAAMYDPENPTLLELLGDILYFSQDMEQSADYYKKALVFNPRSDSLKNKLDKLNKEYAVEKNLRSKATEIFDIRFDKKDARYDIADVKMLLNQAYRQIGQDLNHFPRREVVVILYNEEDYRALSNSHEWVAAHYDGKIRIPMGAATLHGDNLRRIIRHEYAHAVIFDITQGNCPVWLNEGTAKYMEYKPDRPELRFMKEALMRNSLIPFGDLSDVISSSADGERVGLAYLECYTIVEFIVKRFGMYDLSKVLNDLKDKMTIAEALEKELYLSKEEFEKRWLKYLNNL